MSSFLLHRLFSLVVALTLLKLSSASGSGSCQDDPTYRHWGSPYRDCGWIKDVGWCDWSTNNKVIGDYYCPVSCDRCPPNGDDDDDDDGTETTASVDKTCYEYGEDIVVSFSNGDPYVDDWVGIYSSSVSSSNLRDNDKLWLFACGDQHNFCAVSYGTLTFGSE